VKKSVLTGALIALLAVAAQAQVAPNDPGESRRGSFRFGSPRGYGPGYGYGYGYGYGGGWSPYPGSGLFYGYPPGCGYSYGNGSSVYSFGGSMSYAYGGYLPGGVGGYGGGGYYGYPGGLSRPTAAVDVAGPVPRPAPVADRLPEFASSRQIEEGRRRFRMGDYRGAADEFRAAVIAQTDNALAQAWFALTLVITGDGKNADKALRAAAGSGFPADRIGLADLFRDDKERARVVAGLSKVGSDGSLTAAYALSLAGDSARLKQIAEKDPVARLLLPKP
jgi:hypothetical protein